MSVRITVSELEFVIGRASIPTIGSLEGFPEKQSDAIAQAKYLSHLCEALYWLRKAEREESAK